MMRLLLLQECLLYISVMNKIVHFGALFRVDLLSRAVLDCFHLQTIPPSSGCLLPFVPAKLRDVSKQSPAVWLAV
jgi:hypothetical protein